MLSLVGEPLQVAVADGVIHASTGTCKPCLKLDQLSADLTCHVVELADAYGIILGEDSLCKYSAALSWGHKCCVLTKDSHRITDSCQASLIAESAMSRCSSQSS